MPAPFTPPVAVTVLSSIVTGPPAPPSPLPMPAPFPSLLAATVPPLIVT